MSTTIGLGRPTTTSSSSARASTRHPRVSSQAAFSVFDAAQIQTFKEAFSLIDQDNDGLISEQDLIGVLTSLGQTPSPKVLKSFLTCRPSSHESSSTASNQISFAMYLTMMAEHLSEMDTEMDLLEAFSCFDEGDKGWISGKELQKWLKEVGDRMSDQEIERFLTGPFTDRNGSFNYRAFCETLRVTDVDDELARANERAIGV